MSKHSPVHIVFGYIEGDDNFVVSGYGKSDKAALTQARETAEKKFGENEGRVAYYYIRDGGKVLAQSRAWRQQ